MPEQETLRVNASNSSRKPRQVCKPSQRVAGLSRNGHSDRLDVFAQSRGSHWFGLSAKWHDNIDIVAWLSLSSLYGIAGKRAPIRTSDPQNGTVQESRRKSGSFHQHRPRSYPRSDARVFLPGASLLG